MNQPRARRAERARSILVFLYSAALIVCFLCDLGTGGGLSWSLIVLCAVGLAFSVTALPLLLRGHRLFLSALAATACVYLLLLACSPYAPHGWLLRYAYPIASFPLLCGWLLLLALWVRMPNWFFKSAVLALLGGVFLLTINVWVAAVLDGGGQGFAQYFMAQFGVSGTSYLVNGLLAVCFFGYALVGTALGAARAAKKKT